MSQTPQLQQLNSEQQRAKFAMEKIEDFVQHYRAENEAASNFRSYIQALPAMIQMNGFGQAFAFYYMKATEKKKGYEAYQAICHMAKQWLVEEKALLNNGENIMKAITASDMEQYRLAQIEFLQLNVWLKKCALALIPAKSTGEGES